MLKRLSASVGFSDLSKHAMDSEYFCKAMDCGSVIETHDALVAELSEVVSLIEDRITQRQERKKSE